MKTPTYEFTVEGVLALLRSRGMRITRSRRGIMLALFKASRPLSLQEIQAQALLEGGMLPDYATVFRMMILLESLGAVQPDAVFVDDAGRLTLVEVEGGGALTNYRGMKDIVETILLPFVDHLALVVPFVAHHTEPYRYYNRLTQALYAEQVVQRHLSGILVVGY